MSESKRVSFIVVDRGNLIIPAETYTLYLSGKTAVALLNDSDGVFLIPLIEDSAGGLILKVRNSRGDRVVHAQEFFRFHRFDETAEQTEIAVNWDNQRGALRLEWSDLLRN